MIYPSVVKHVRHLSFLFIGTVLITNPSWAANGNGPPDQAPVAIPAKPIADRTLAVKYHEGVSDERKAEIAKSVKALRANAVAKSPRFKNTVLGQWQSLSFAVGKDIDAIKAQLESLPEVMTVGFDYMTPPDPAIIPNDTWFNDQYGLNNIGQWGGTPDADIDALFS